MDYYSWLVMIAFPEGYRRQDYSMLLQILMETEYYWVVPRDENRARDGLDLRELYEEETGEDCLQYGPCSVLEMLLALAMRINEDILYDPDEPDKVSEWFWMLLKNLKVDVFTDENFSKTDILDILYGFMDKSVHFCPFLFPNPPPNFAKKEVWIQVNSYINWRFLGDFR